MSKAEESFDRNVIIYNQLVKVHKGDPQLIAVDIVMQFALMLVKIKDNDYRQELKLFAIKSLTELKP